MSVSTLFIKTSLSFPSHDLLWSFRQETRAIHIRIEPKKNIITGLFSPQDIDKAVRQFHAVNIPQA